MKYKQHSGNAGEYYPAFFEMKLKVDDMIDLNSCSEKDFSLFFHEYIHFLQDVTTSYGIVNCYYCGEYIQSVVNDIRNKGIKSGPIKVPYFYDDNKDNIKIEEIIYNVTMGDSREDWTELKNVKCELEPYTFDPPEAERLKEINCVKLTDDAGAEFALGAYAIKENMAYILERLITKDYEPSKDYPYCAVERYVESFFPEFGNNIINVLALCDCCLMFSNPAEVLYKILNQMKNKHYVPNKPQDLYDKLPNAKIGNGEIITNPVEYFETSANEVRKKLKSYFFIPDHPDIYEPYHKWVDRLIDYSIYLRTQQPHFIIDLVMDGYARRNNTFASIVKNIGTPLIRNNKSEYFSIKPEGCDGFNVEINKAVHQLYSILHDGYTVCSLYPWCASSTDINPSVDVCLKRPWERCDCEKLCPVAMLWKNWGLCGYIPTKA